MSPQVSVIIPAYNQARFVAQAVDSALLQSFADKEIIVVNDGSTDETANILGRYSDQVRVITQENAGLSAARNSGLLAARGRYVAFLDADDLWFPQMLSTSVELLEKHTDADLVIGGWDCVDASGERITDLHKPASSYPHRTVQEDFLRATAVGNMFPVHAHLVRRKCFECCGAFEPTLRAFEDWDLWLRMAAHGHKVLLTDVPVARYRYHAASMSRDLTRMEVAYDQVLARLFANPAAVERVADLQVHARIGKWLLLANYFLAAGGEADFRRCIRNATELFADAPLRAELSERYFSMALERFPRFAEVSRFIRMVGKTVPDQLAKYYSKQARRAVRDGDYWEALRNVFGWVSTSRKGAG